MLLWGTFVCFYRDRVSWKSFYKIRTIFMLSFTFKLQHTFTFHPTKTETYPSQSRLSAKRATTRFFPLSHVFKMSKGVRMDSGTTDPLHKEYAFGKPHLQLMLWFGASLFLGVSPSNKQEEDKETKPEAPWGSLLLQWTIIKLSQWTAQAGTAFSRKDDSAVSLSWDNWRVW